jgi:replicative DNA helicase
MGNRKQNKPIDINGLVPPQATELEEAVLGGILMENTNLGEVVTMLPPNAFYDIRHNHVYEAIIHLFKNNKPVDILTVTQRLKEVDKLNEVGGAYFVSTLTSRVASSVNTIYHARIILENYLKRELIRINTMNTQTAYDFNEDVFDIYEKNIQMLESSLSSVLKYDVSKIGDIHEKIIQESINVIQSGEKSGVPTGYRNLDNFTNGWQKTDLIIIAGRPGMGKSVCGLAFALNPALRNNIPTAIFSLEMSKEQVVGRAQSCLSEINSSSIIKKQLTMQDVSTILATCQDFNTAPIYIDDTPSLNIMELKNKARKLVRDKGVKLIVLDYLQLMVGESNKNGNREQEISKISQGLKALAKELDVPIIALSQLSRAVEARGGDKKPMLSDLRESGSIEQDADMVIFCYRPEYYNIENYELGGETLETEGLMCLIVAKHRAGSLGELRMGFSGDYTRLENYDTYIERKRYGNTQQSNTIQQEATNYATGRNTMASNTEFLENESREVEEPPF